MKSENFSKKLGKLFNMSQYCFCDSENLLNLKRNYELSIFIRQNNMLLCASSPKGFKNVNFISKMPPFLFVLPWKQLMQPKLNLLHTSNSFISWNLKTYTLLIIYYRYFNSWLLQHGTMPLYTLSNYGRELCLPRISGRQWPISDKWCLSTDFHAQQIVHPTLSVSKA